MPKHPEMIDLAVFPPLSGATHMPVPAQIAASIASLIDKGVLPAGTQLPGQAELCKHWGVGINTTRQAMRSLAEQGRVLLRHGLPTVVAERGAGPQTARAEAERLHVVASKGARRRWGRPGWQLLSNGQRQAFVALELLRLIARQRSEITDRFVRELVECGYDALALDSGTLASHEEEDAP